VAQAFDLAGITNTVGAPSFAFLAKGGHQERIRNGVCAERTKVASAASLPALAKSARTGHPLHRWRTRPSSERRATRTVRGRAVLSS